MLLVEVDGSQHVESGYDNRRDAHLLKEGYSILRVPSVMWWTAPANGI
jgi:very-short-patch-repair endonuclease